MCLLVAFIRGPHFWTREEFDRKGWDSKDAYEPVEFGPESTETENGKNAWEFGPTIVIKSIGSDADEGAFFNTGYLMCSVMQIEKPVGEIMSAEREEAVSVK